MRKEKIITIILIASCMISTPLSIYLTGIIEIKYLGGLLFTSASGIAYIYFRKYFKIILFVTLLLGTVDVLQFIVFENTYGFSISAFGLSITISLQIFSFILLLVFLHSNRQRVKMLLKDVFKENTLTQEELSNIREMKIESFKTKYRNKSVDELRKISNSPNVFDFEAVEAAMILLKEKNER
jgi:hypothetical protein